MDIEAAIIGLVVLFVMLFAQTQHQQIRINRLKRRLEKMRLEVSDLKWECMALEDALHTRNSK